MIRRRRAALLRVAGEPSSLPRMHVVDLRSHQGSRAAGWPLISPPLERAIDAALQRDGRALLWLNRLGFATRVQCHQCGHVLQCKRCTAPLTFFSRRRELRCRMVIILATFNTEDLEDIIISQIQAHCPARRSRIQKIPTTPRRPSRLSTLLVFWQRPHLIPQ